MQMQICGDECLCPKLYEERTTMCSNLFLFAEVYQSVYWQSPLPVSEYHSYSSVRVLEFTVPEMCEKSIWLFTALKSQDDCPDRHVDV